jgi:hypothetical protein
MTPGMDNWSTSLQQGSHRRSQMSRQRNQKAIRHAGPQKGKITKSLAYPGLASNFSKSLHELHLQVVFCLEFQSE